MENETDDKREPENVTSNIVDTTKDGIVMQQ